MAPRVVAILIHPSGWSLGLANKDGVSLLPIEAQVDSSMTDQVAAVRASAEQAGTRIGNVVLALPSTWCYSASVATDGVARRNRHAALLYRLEEFLPLDAEALTADFVGSGHHALGVAVQSERVLEIIEALEAEDIGVCSICPTTLLTLQRTVQAYPDQQDAYLVIEKGRFDLLRMRGGLPESWRQGIVEAKSLRRVVEQLALQPEATLPLAVVGESAEDALDIIPPQPEFDVTQIDTRPSLAAVETAKQIVEDGDPAWIDLCRDRLAMKDRLTRVNTPLRFAAAALAFLLIAIAVVTGWRGAQYQHVAYEQRQEQETLFREAFPGQDVPLMVLARFRSEQRRLNGMSGLSGDLPEQTSALSMLHHALVSLPGDMRYRVLELRLDPNRIYLDGQARSHGDADLIAASLRQRDAFVIEPPRTENLPDRGIVFTLTGTPSVSVGSSEKAEQEIASSTVETGRLP